MYTKDKQADRLSKNLPSIQFQENRFSGYRAVRCGQADRRMEEQA